MCTMNTTVAAIYPYVHISNLRFENSITSTNGLISDKSNVSVVLTNAAIFGKHGYVRFHWLSVLSSNTFTSDDIFGEEYNLADQKYAEEIKIFVPLELLKKASDNGGRAGIYYQYVEDDNVDPISVGKPTSAKDNSVGKSQTFNININELKLHLLAPLPDHDPVTPNDLKLGYKVTIPDYAGKAINQIINLHWRQVSQDIVIGPYPVTSPDIGGRKIIELTENNIKTPKDGVVEFFYKVTNDSGQVATSSSASVHYGQSFTKLIAPNFRQSSGGVIDITSLPNIQVEIVQSTPIVEIRNMTVVLEGLDIAGKLKALVKKKRPDSVVLPATLQFEVTAFIDSAIMGLRAYYYIDDDSNKTSPSITVTVKRSAASSDGILYGAGWHGYSNLGGEDSNLIQHALSELPSELNVKFLPHGSGRYSHSAIGVDGHIYSWGANDWQETGNGQSGRQKRAQAEFVGARPKVAFVSNGPFHTLALEFDGTLWGAGCMRNGRLALGVHPDDRYTQFTKATTDIKFSFVSAAGSGGGEWDGYSSLGIGKDDSKLYGWGASDTGVLGQGKNSVPDTFSPMLVDSSRKWQWVAHNYFRAAGITTEGALYTWGFEDGSGVLGRGTTVGKITTPTRVSILGSNNKDILFKKVLCGQYFMIALDTQGNVWGWGKNWYCALGGAGQQDASGIMPTKIPGMQGSFVDIATDWASAAAVNSDGALYTWGGNERGQLGLDITNSVVNVPTIVKTGAKITQVSFGCYALFALAE